MGAAATQNTGSQVYFDPGSQRYYTLNIPSNPNVPSGINSMLMPLYNIASDSSQYRNYINGASYQEPTPFTPASAITNLFPNLTMPVSSSLMSPQQGQTGQMYGAGRFLNSPAISNTSQSESK
jgi:hypothetical protein